MISNGCAFEQNSLWNEGVVVEEPHNVLVETPHDGSAKDNDVLATEQGLSLAPPVNVTHLTDCLY